jgi:hypothetical protein
LNPHPMFLEFLKATRLQWILEVWLANLE